MSFFSVLLLLLLSYIQIPSWLLPEHPQSIRDYEIFTSVKIQVKVFWVVMSCSDVVRYQRFRGPCYLHLLYFDAVKCCGRTPTFRRSVMPPSSGWRHYGQPKRWYPITSIHGVTTQKTSSWTSVYVFYRYGNTNFHTHIKQQVKSVILYILMFTF